MNQSTAIISPMSSNGRLTAWSTTMVVTAPADGIPAAPIAIAVAVTLKTKFLLEVHRSLDISHLALEKQFKVLTKLRIDASRNNSQSDWVCWSKRFWLVLNKPDCIWDSHVIRLSREFHFIGRLLGYELLVSMDEKIMNNRKTRKKRKKFSFEISHSLSSSFLPVIYVFPSHLKSTFNLNPFAVD